MNKSELAKAAACKTDMPQRACLEVVDAVFAAIQESLASHEEVNIPSFGKFTAPKKAETTRRNPLTGESFRVPAHHSIKFAPAKALKDAVR